MASLALGALGAGVGSMFGYASIGWSIGSFIGGQLFGQQGQDLKGPRLQDKSISTSAYGNQRPFIYGSYRVGGEIIWSTDLVEHKHKEEAGKGGGGGGSYTSYTYTVSFAMALCKGEISGIRKIWFDGKLIYNLAEGATPAELQVSDDIAKRIHVHYGTYTQTADSIIEASLGAGNVPGYRGTAYLVFEDLEVTPYGNRIPQVTVEVVKDGTYIINGSPITTGVASARSSLSLNRGVASAFSWVFSDDGSNHSQGIFEQRLFSLTDMTRRASRYSFVLAGGDESFGWRYLYQQSQSPNGQFMIVAAGDAGTGNNKTYRLMLNAGITASYIDILRMRTDLDNYENGDSRDYNIFWEDDNNIWFYKANDGDIYHYEIVIGLLGTISVTDEHFNVDSTRQNSDALGGIHTFCMDRATGELYVEIISLDGTQKSIKRYTRDGELLETKFIGVTWRSFRGRLMAYSNGVLYETLGLGLNAYDWDSETLIGTTTIATNGTYITGAIMEASGALLTVMANGVLYNYSITLGASDEPLDEVVSDICQMVGIDPSEIDVTDLEDEVVHGYLIGNQTAARGSLEQLSAAYFFDGRESDGVLEFIMRGDTPSITLDDDDLGCYEGVDVAELVDTERMQEEELPKALTLNYANLNADYQIGAQHSLRQSVLNGTETTIQLPIAFNDDEAKAIIDKMMFVAWENRHKFTLNTWQKFHKIDPADVIYAHGETMRVVSRDEGVNGILQLTCVRELPYIYTGQVGTGATSGHGNQSVTVQGPTQFELLDIPPMRDADYDRYGIYWAAAGLMPDWSGASLFRSEDGNTFDYMSQISNASVIGQATTALGNWTGGNFFDEANTVRVSVNGTLETVTRDQVLNNANVAILGDELIQFRTATLVSTGVYDLTGFLRGRMGTEPFMSTHAVFDRFVLIDSNDARFVEIPSVDYNTSRTWGAVTFGDTIEHIITDQLTYEANNQKPLPPVHIGGGTVGQGQSWTINWVRRSRYRWQWLDSSDVGSDEPILNFDVAILNGSTIVRPISVTGALTATYTLAQQVADFGYWQPSITVKVRQVGDVTTGEWSDSTVITSSRNSLMLLHFDGANNSTTFTDEYGTPLTANGNAHISTTQSKFGVASGNFDGTGDYLSFTRNLGITKAVGFTIDCWVYITGNTGTDGNGFRTAAIFTLGSGSNFMTFMINGDGTTTGTGLYIEGRTAGVLYGVSIASSISQNAWHHIEVGVNNTATYFFIDGVLSSASALTQNLAVTSENYIGKSLTTTFERGFLGYIDELRITPRVQHTANFTPPTSAYTE